MNPPPVLIQTSRRSSSKKKKFQDLQKKPSAFQDEEQIATQNLFNVANLQDSVSQQKKFNTTFDLFQSVNFNEESEQDEYPHSNLIKTSRNDRQMTYYPDSLQLKVYKRFSTEKTKKIYIKNYETVPQAFSNRSQLLRMKRGKVDRMMSSKEKNSLVLNQLKSNTVFVGKTTITGSQEKNLSQNYFNKLLKNLSSPNKHKNCHKLRLGKTQTDDQRSLSFFQPNPLSINDQVKSYINKQTPQLKDKMLNQPLMRKQRLERLKKTISQQTHESYSQSIGKNRKTNGIKAAKNLEFMNDRILGLDEFTDYSFRNRHSNYRKQRN